MRSVLDDRVLVKDYWLAIALIYAGHDLVSLTPKDRYTEFVMLVPKFDYEDYYKEFHAGELQISDAKAFGRTATDRQTHPRCETRLATVGEPRLRGTAAGRSTSDKLKDARPSMVAIGVGTQATGPAPLFYK
jgi:hypothetical protein